MSVSSCDLSLMLSSPASSSPEPSTSNSLFDDTLILIYEVLDLENYPCTDYDWIVTFGRRRVIKLLLEKDCRAIKHGSVNPTLRKCIKDFSWPNVLEQLAHLGATVTDRNCKGDTALHLAFANGATEGRVFNSMLESYLNNATENVMNNDGLSLLHIACAKASAAKVEQLLEKYPSDINRQVAVRNRVPYAGYTALHFAVEFNRYEIVDLLLRNNADFCMGNRLGVTPLHLALYATQGTDASEMIDIIDLIFCYDKENENCIDNFGLSHLMVASAGSKVGVVEKILRVACHRDLPPSYMVNRHVMDTMKNPFGGYSPLHFAAQYGNFETAHLLLCNGASTYALTTDKYTPVALSRLKNHDIVLRLLQYYSDQPSWLIPMNRSEMASSRVCSAFVDQPIVEAKPYVLF